MSQPHDSAMLGLAMRFKVQIDGLDLGHWATCKGLHVTFKSDLVREGGNYEYAPILPDRIEYATVTLQRAMSPEASDRVQRWLRDFADNWMTGYGRFQDHPGATASISLCDATGQVVASWTLRRVFPRSWRGPDLDGRSSAVAVETLDLVHEGFL
ncbi:phage tail protein [Phytohabitans suffuscus]|uniref:Phage tail protein n=1 Tax=Phytohabitans suffuscus TaxID=624315 RepID=A0A6F8YSA0_9ACTN|nr:phage tail protein [Phytohabitans suffuscus]BCB88711.1 hypothetical protein Psuf_060240 [Phytohabitans suffuscus]